MLFAVLSYSVKDRPDGAVIERILADHFTFIFDDWHSNIVFLAPVGLGVDIPILDISPATNQGQQLFKHNLTKVATSTGVVVDDGHLVLHRRYSIDDHWREISQTLLASKSNFGGQDTADKANQGRDRPAGVACSQAICQNRRQNSAGQRVAVNDHRSTKDIARRQHNADEVAVLKIQILSDDRLNPFLSGFPSQQPGSTSFARFASSADKHRFHLNDGPGT